MSRLLNCFCREQPAGPVFPCAEAALKHQQIPPESSCGLCGSLLGGEICLTAGGGKALSGRYMLLHMYFSDTCQKYTSSQVRVTVGLVPQHVTKSLAARIAQTVNKKVATRCCAEVLTQAGMWVLSQHVPPYSTVWFMQFKVQL